MTPAPSHSYMEAVPVCWRQIADGPRDPGGSIWITIFHLPRIDEWLVAIESSGVTGVAARPAVLYRGPSDAQAIGEADAALRSARWREFGDVQAAAVAPVFHWQELADYRDAITTWAPPLDEVLFR